MAKENPIIPSSVDKFASYISGCHVICRYRKHIYSYTKYIIFTKYKHLYPCARTKGTLEETGLTQSQPQEESSGSGDRENNGVNSDHQLKGKTVLKCCT